MNLIYNTVYTTGNPGQYFEVEVLQHFSKPKSAAKAGQLLIVGDDWATSGPVGTNEKNYEGDKKLEGVDEEESNIPKVNNRQGSMPHEAFNEPNVNNFDFEPQSPTSVHPPPNQQPAPSPSPILHHQLPSLLLLIYCRP